MGLFDFIKKKPSGTKYGYAPSLNHGLPVFSQFGDNIYNSDVVQQALNCIVREVKKLEPQHIIKKGSDITPVYDDIQRVLDNPNDLMTTTDFIEKIVWQLFFNYNTFVFPTFENGKLTGLYPLQPVNVEFLQDTRGDYHIKMKFLNGYESTIPYRDIIHIRYNFSVNEFMGGNASGQPDHSALLETLKLNDVMLKGVGKALKSSFAINGIVKYNTILDNEKTEKAISDLTDKLMHNESGLLPLDLKGEFIPFKRDLEMVDSETLKFIDEKILRTFGVPICMLTGDYTKEQYESFYQKTIEPIIKSLNQSFTKALFTVRESNGYGHEIQFYSKDLNFMTNTQKLEMIRLLGDSGALYENEKRVILGLQPLPELEGIRKQSLNYVDTDIANQYQTGDKNKNTESDGTDDDEEIQSESDNETGLQSRIQSGR